MGESSSFFNGIKDKRNIIDAHRQIDDSVKMIARYASTKDDAAGGIYSNIDDLSKWLLMFLNNGIIGQNLDAITDQIVDGYLHIEGIDESKRNFERLTKANLREDSAKKELWRKVNDQHQNMSAELKRFTGTYHNAWFGRNQMAKSGNRRRYLYPI
jgi:hypothetical protein